MIDLLYITSFFIIGIILYLILKDLKKLKNIQKKKKEFPVLTFYHKLCIL